MTARSRRLGPFGTAQEAFQGLLGLPSAVYLMALCVLMRDRSAEVDLVSADNADSFELCKQDPVAHRFGFSWADAQTLKMWQLAALVDHMDTEHKRLKAAQAEARRRR